MIGPTAPVVGPRPMRAAGSWQRTRGIVPVSTRVDAGWRRGADRGARRRAVAGSPFVRPPPPRSHPGGVVFHACPRSGGIRTARRRPPRVLANRGANGIDGVLSTALGVALATGGPTVALVGDLAFLHDVSALVRSDDLDANLTIVVADNAGGGIFSFLAPATVLDEASFDRLFGTPQSPDPAAVATGLGWPVDDLGPGPAAGELRPCPRPTVERGRDVRHPGPPPGRAENVAVHDRINAAIVRAVDGRSWVSGGGGVMPGIRRAAPGDPADERRGGSRSGPVNRRPTDTDAERSTEPRGSAGSGVERGDR